MEVIFLPIFLKKFGIWSAGIFIENLILPNLVESFLVKEFLESHRISQVLIFKIWNLDYKYLTKITRQIASVTKYCSIFL